MYVHVYVHELYMVKFSAGKSNNDDKIALCTQYIEMQPQSSFCFHTDNKLF